MKIKNKQEKQLQVGFNDEVSEEDLVLDNDGVADSGPKIIILQGIFTLNEVHVAEKRDGISEDQFFEELEEEIKEKLKIEIPNVVKFKPPKLEFFRQNP